MIRKHIADDPDRYDLFYEIAIRHNETTRKKVITSTLHTQIVQLVKKHENSIHALPLYTTHGESIQQSVVPDKAVLATCGLCGENECTVFEEFPNSVVRNIGGMYVVGVVDKYQRPTIDTTSSVLDLRLVICLNCKLHLNEQLKSINPVPNPVPGMHPFIMW
jgi:hypothetical protein